MTLPFLIKPTTPIADPDTGQINSQWFSILMNLCAGAFDGSIALEPRGVTWTHGSAAPTSTQPIGSLYSRDGGAVGATLYVSRGAGVWNAVAGV